MRKLYWGLWVVMLLVLGLCLAARRVSGLFFQFTFDNPWLLCIFVQFGVLIMGAALLMVEEATARGYPRLIWVEISAYLILGVVALLPFLALRGENAEKSVGRRARSPQPALSAPAGTLSREWQALRRPPSRTVGQLPAWVSNRWVWLVLAGLVLASLVYALQSGDLEQTREAIVLDPTLGFMILNFWLNTILIAPLIRSDAERRDIDPDRFIWLTRFSGALGLANYFWLRTRIRSAQRPV